MPETEFAVEICHVRLGVYANAFSTHPLECRPESDSHNLFSQTAATPCGQHAPHVDLARLVGWKEPSISHDIATVAHENVERVTVCLVHVEIEDSLLYEKYGRASSQDFVKLVCRKFVESLYFCSHSQ